MSRIYVRVRLASEFSTWLSFNKATYKPLEQAQRCVIARFRYTANSHSQLDLDKWSLVSKFTPQILQTQQVLAW